MPAGARRRQVLRTLWGAAVAVASGAALPGRAEASRQRRESQSGSTASLGFAHERIDVDPPTPALRLVAAADLTGNGRDDVVVAGAGEATNLWLFGERTGLPSRSGLQYELGRGDPTLFWYENPGWRRHEVAAVPGLSGAGTLVDLTGDGRLDLVVGRAPRDRSLLWFEQPAEPTTPWRRHLATEAVGAAYDLAVADVDDDGAPEVVGLSPEDGELWYYDVPDDPRRSPWPAEGRHVVATGTSARGVRAVDVDGDGRTELLAGDSVYRRRGNGHEWVRERLAEGFERAIVDAADLDGDGAPEVVLAGGGSTNRETRPGRIAWVDTARPDPRLLRSGPRPPHSLDVADVDGDGTPDVFVAERGGRTDDPRLVVYVNRGGSFRERVIARGVPTSSAALADLTDGGRPDVVGISSGPAAGVHAWYHSS